MTSYFSKNLDTFRHLRQLYYQYSQMYQVYRQQKQWIRQRDIICWLRIRVPENYESTIWFYWGQRRNRREEEEEDEHIVACPNSLNCWNIEEWKKSRVFHLPVHLRNVASKRRGLRTSANGRKRNELFVYVFGNYCANNIIGITVVSTNCYLHYYI